MRNNFYLKLLGLLLASVLVPQTLAEDVVVVSGSIIDVDWPDQDIISTTLLVPWITVMNTGGPTTFYVRFSMRGINNKMYFGSCTPTGVLQHDEQKVVWPGGIQVNSAMPKGSYSARIELYSEHCSKADMLDTVTKDHAFDIMI